MSTRRLIALALACGMAILLAGGLQLFLLTRESGDDPTGALLEPGVAADVGIVTASVAGAERTEAGDVVLGVRAAVAGTGIPVDDLEAGWGLLRGDSGRLVARVDGAGTCAGLVVEPGETVTCTVVFRPDGDAGDAFVALYGRDDQRASWSVEVP